MDIDLKKLSTFELQKMHQECIEKITKMTADLGTVTLCVAIEQELKTRS